MAQKDFVFDDPAASVRLCGSLGENLKILEREFLVTISDRGERWAFLGDEDNVAAAVRAAEAMLHMLRTNDYLDEQSVRYCVNLVKSGNEAGVAELGGESVLITPRGKPIRPRTLGQKKYVEALKKNTIVISIGPAGTGKTYLAVAMAVRALKAHEVSRIILTRPAVEAGERLGFLPGDMQNKVDPYLRPLYDALFDTMGQESFSKLMEKGIIEVAPLAYMRGRTLENAFIILDEAQNTTGEQIKMFLTRIGNGSRMAVNGDVTQIDLPRDKKSGLVEAARVLNGIEGLEIVRFSEKDVVRSRIVSDIIKTYDRGGRPQSDRKR